MTITTKTSLNELMKKKARGDISPPLPIADEVESDLPDNFWNDAKIVDPSKKKQVNLRIDTDIIDFFKEDGSGHLTRMHSVLRAYVDAKSKNYSPS